MQISQRKLKDWLLHRIQVRFILRFHLQRTKFSKQQCMKKTILNRVLTKKLFGVNGQASSLGMGH